MPEGTTNMNAEQRPSSPAQTAEVSSATEGNALPTSSPDTHVTPGLRLRRMGTPARIFAATALGVAGLFGGHRMTTAQGPESTTVPTAAEFNRQPIGPAYPPFGKDAGTTLVNGAGSVSEMRPQTPAVLDRLHQTAENQEEPGKEDAPMQEIPLTVFDRGSGALNSNEDGKAERLFITTPEEWNKFLDAFYGVNPDFSNRPKDTAIDFGKYDIVAAIDQTRPNGGYAIDLKAFENDTTVNFQVTTIVPAPDSPNYQVVTRPYIIAMLSKAAISNRNIAFTDITKQRPSLNDYQARMQ